MPLLDHFGILAPFYDKVIRLKDADRIIKFADLPVQGSLLDVGGGTGRITQTLRGYADPLVVADLSVEMLSQAQIKGGLQPVCLHSELLPFADESYERVIMVDALHHVIDQKRSAAELWRVVKPGGRIVVEEPDIKQFSVKMVALGEKIALMRSHFLAPEQIVPLFNFPKAKVEIFRQDFNAWVVIEKQI